MDLLSIDYDQYTEHVDSRPPSPVHPASQPPTPHSAFHTLGTHLGLSSPSPPSPPLPPPQPPLPPKQPASSIRMSTPEATTSWMPANVQDRLFARLLKQVLPSDYNIEDYAAGKFKRKDVGRPGFSLALMSTNFRRFNARIGVVFVFQNRLIRVLQWRNPTHTIAALAIYSFVCLDPYLLVVIPCAVLLLFVMVPAFIARHPPPPSSLPWEKYTPSGPAIAPPPEVRAVSEISKDFFRNLRDLQNSMEDFSVLHDQIITLVGPATNFSDEALSTGVFLVLFFFSISLFICAAIIPWRLIFLAVGWVGFLSNHPALQDALQATHETHLKPREKNVFSFMDSFVHRDITLSAIAETREVEIFEIQRRTMAGEYEPWLFSPTAYEQLSPTRIADERPQGTRFFEDVRPPLGWEWSEGKWTLDLGSLTWVQERFVNGVEVEEESERWVYDSEDGVRGLWRRRRWVRNVKRKYQVRQEDDS